MGNYIWRSSFNGAQQTLRGVPLIVGAKYSIRYTFLGAPIVELTLILEWFVAGYANLNDGLDRLIIHWVTETGKHYKTDSAYEIHSIKKLEVSDAG